MLNSKVKEYLDSLEQGLEVLEYPNVELNIARTRAGYFKTK